MASSFHPSQPSDDVWIRQMESGTSTPRSSNDEAPKPWYRRSRSESVRALLRIGRRKPRSFSPVNHEKRARRRLLRRWAFLIFLMLCLFAIIAYATYVALVGALLARVKPPKTSSGLRHIVDSWKEPDAKGAYKFDWRDDFSQGITPKSCHSHNDYWRSVPLYEALSYGCMGVEADIWLTSDGKDFLVGHSWKSTKSARTLKSLYLDPLSNILRNRNVTAAKPGDRDMGIFDADPNASVILLIDFKSDGATTWPLLLSQLEPLQQQGWLTYFNGSQVIPGPLTIVGTGNTPFDLVTKNTTRFIFYDAPLMDVSNPKYTTENSYYASTPLRDAIGHIWFNKLTETQLNKLKTQIKAADDKGLKSRYWSTPSWPISLRDKVWFKLTDFGVGMLNVDDLYSATRWNWNWCTVAGLELCGKE